MILKLKKLDTSPFLNFNLLFYSKIPELDSFISFTWQELRKN